MRRRRRPLEPLADALSAPEAEPLDPKERVERLRAAFDGAERGLVLAHDNPDPDALASVQIVDLFFKFKHLMQHKQAEQDCENYE